MSDQDPEDPQNPEPPFDAVKAAAEFAAAMAEEPSTPSDGTPSSGGDRYTALLEDEVETLRALLADKEAALAAAQSKAAAATAEIDRVRVRIETSANGTIERKRRSVIESFLDVADALDRAAAALAAGGDISPALAHGVHGVRAELHAVLGRHGARQRASIGEPFDPAHHEAIATVPATAETPAGTITAVLSEGYEIDSETLRVARVVVATD